MPTLIYTQDAPPAQLVLEDQDDVDRALAAAREQGAERVRFTGEGGKDVEVEVTSVRWTSAQ
jgi:hypothetical protein